MTARGCCYLFQPGTSGLNTTKVKIVNCFFNFYFNYSLDLLSILSEFCTRNLEDPLASQNQLKPSRSNDIYPQKLLVNRVTRVTRVNCVVDDPTDSMIYMNVVCYTLLISIIDLTDLTDQNSLTLLSSQAGNVGNSLPIPIPILVNSLRTCSWQSRADRRTRSSSRRTTMSTIRRNTTVSN